MPFLLDGLDNLDLLEEIALIDLLEIGGINVVDLIFGAKETPLQGFIHNVDCSLRYANAAFTALIEIHPLQRP